MAITLSYIPRVILARDQMPVTFTTDNYKTSEGVLAQSRFHFFSYPSVGDTFTISTSVGDFVFTCATTPDDSGYQFEPGIPPESLNDYVIDKIFPVVSRNYDISKYFDVTLFEGGPYILLTSRTEENFNIDTDSSDFTVVNIQIAAGSPAVFRENFKVNFQLFNFLTNESVSPIISLEPNSDQTVTTDIQEFLSGLAETNFVFESTEVYENLNNDAFELYIRYWESYGIGDSATNRVFANSSRYITIQGATSWIDQALLNEQNTYWWDSVRSGYPWLTKKPDNNYVLPNQKVLLKFITSSPQYANSPLYLIIKSYDTNNNVETLQYNIGAPLEYKVIQLDVSPSRHTLIADAVRYEVYLQSTYLNQVRTKILTFNIDKSYYNNIRYLFYKNNFGGFDTIQALGLSEVDESYKRQRTTTTLPNKFTRTDRETRVASVDHEVTFKVNLGFSNNWGDSINAWANYIRQLFATLEGYEIIQGEIYPIDIKNTKQMLFEDENYMPEFFEAEYSRAFIETGATSDIPAIQGSYTDQYDEPYN